jgi:hypothetical protein
MTTQRRIARGLVFAAIAAAAACSDDGTDPLARTVTLTPAATNGSAVVTFVGAPIASVVSDEGQVFSSIRGDTTRVVLLLDEPGPLRFGIRLTQPDLEPVGAVVQVADGDNRLLPDVSQYRVEVNP